MNKDYDSGVTGSEAAIACTFLITVLVLAILFAGEPDLMSTVIDYIKRH